MSRISADLKKTIEEIKRLADGSVDDQFKSKKLLREKIFPHGNPKPEVDESIIQELLPTIIKFMESNDHVLEKEGADFVISITNTPDEKANTKLVIDAGGIKKLVKLLSSTITEVLISAMKAFVNIASDFPEKVIENEILQSIIQYLKSEHKRLPRLAIWFLLQISYDSEKRISEERIAAIFDANGVKPLIEILESKDDVVIKGALGILSIIIICNGEFCQRVLDYGALKSIKKLCDRLFAVKKPRRNNVEVDESELEQEKTVKYYVITFLKIVISYDEAHVDLIIKENLDPIILQHIKSGMTSETKTAEPTPPNVDMTATSASRQSPPLSVAASTNNETDQDEIKPSTVVRFGNPSRLSSNHSHVVLESASSTNDENIRNNHSGRSTAVDSETAATADETIRNGFNPVKRTPTHDVSGNPLSRPTSAIASTLPEASASTKNGTIPNDILSRKLSPVSEPVITHTNQITPPAAAAANNDIIRDEVIKYWHPAEFLIHQFCETLGIQFIRNYYVEFISKIKFSQITSNSKPDKCFMLKNDESGFGCFSILLTGNENASSKISDQINTKFIDYLETFDKEKIKKVTLSPIMLAEHLETIAAWLKCRILVYCNGWKKYGSWETEDQMIPIFVLEKKENGYQIVLDLKNNI